ncbi:T9SS type A sorting domain-containing protein [bacterium]
MMRIQDRFKQMIFSTLAVLLFSTWMIQLFAQYPYTISQEALNASSHMYGDQEYGQSVKITDAGSISQIQVSLNPLAYPANVTLNIYEGEGYSTLLFTQDYPVTAEGTIALDFDTPLPVSSDIFTFSITPDQRMFITMSTMNPFSEGTMYFWDGNSIPENDLYFILTVIESPSNISYTSIVPCDFALEQNYPNPFNPSTVISFTIPQTVHVTMTVYNLMGHEVIRLIDGIREAGTHIVEWDASHAPAGTYFYKFQTEGYEKIEKCLLIK